ncbi:MAG: KH domain-containing protein [bacterium]|nr:KH domain-containing protein [bacterium]MDD5353971.1 KH domain-containing protein [bacterium]MDD5756056.1 KH domain-containing protein [bacterium]
MPDNIKDLVEYIVRALVDEPDKVSVNEVLGEQAIVLELRVSQPDIGKVIGKQGRIVKAIRLLLGAAGSKAKKRIVLEIIE